MTGPVKRRRVQAPPSVIDQAIAAFKETWLRAEEIVQEGLQAARRAPVRSVVPAPPPIDPSASLRKGASGEAVSELRIRLAGFGGLLPGDAFDDDVEDSVKQFEKDVMGRDPSGIVDAAFAAALDAFAAKWPIDVEGKLACPCVSKKRLQGCTGFGKGQFKGEYTSAYKKSRDEAGHKYEYPGLHRSLLWAARAVMHYAEVDHPGEIRFLRFSSGYRCHKDNEAHNRTSTNHMGKAVDMQFQHGDGRKWWVADRSQTMEDANAMRDVAKTRMGAQIEWIKGDQFSLEPGGEKKGPNDRKAYAPTWVHMDVRMWSAPHRADEFFIKTSKDLDGESFARIVANRGSSLQSDPAKGQKS